MTLKTVDLEKNARVLLRLPNWAGDVVMATPAIEALKRERADLKLVFALRSHLAPLVEGYPQVEKVFSIEGKSISSSLKFLGEIRKDHFSAVVVFSKGFRDGLLSCFSKSRVRIGFDVNGRGIFFSHAVAMTEELWNKHHSLQMAALFQPLGISLSEKDRPSLPVREKDLEETDILLAKSALKEKDFVVFHIGASKFPRAYHSERFAEAAKTVHGKTGLKIVLIGTKEEKPYIEKFSSVFKEFSDLSGEIPLRLLTAFISRSLLFVGNDSGPMHIASAAGIPVVAVFGPGSPAKTAPLLQKERMRILYAALPCSPCRQSFFKDCDPSVNGKPPCLELLSSEALTGQILGLVENLSH